MSTRKKIDALVEEYIAEERASLARIVSAAACGSPIEELFLMQGLRDGRLSSERWFDAVACPRNIDVGVSQAQLQLLYESHYDGFTGVLWTQAQIDTARVDFALVPVDRPNPHAAIVRIAIELDGHDFHERTKEQAKRDKERDRCLQTGGWVVLRFSGSEVFEDAEGCWDQVDALVHARVDEYYARTEAGKGGAYG